MFSELPDSHHLKHLSVINFLCFPQIKKICSPPHPLLPSNLGEHHCCPSTHCTGEQRVLYLKLWNSVFRTTSRWICNAKYWAFMVIKLRQWSPQAVSFILIPHSPLMAASLSTHMERIGWNNEWICSVAETGSWHSWFDRHTFCCSPVSPASSLLPTWWVSMLGTAARTV